MKEILSDTFRQAVRDFSYLLENDYPRKAILKLIGDRYLLNRVQRTLLNRGIIKNLDAISRADRMVKNIRGQILHVDTYNVLFIISNYLLGRVVFISSDGFIRDAGEAYGKIHRDKVFVRSLEYLAEFLENSAPARICFYIDSPVAFSGELAEKLRIILHDRHMEGIAVTVNNPDKELIRQNEGIIATSDSEVIHKTPCRICDLPTLLLESMFQLPVLDLREYSGLITH